MDVIVPPPNMSQVANPDASLRYFNAELIVKSQLIASSIASFISIPS